MPGPPNPLVAAVHRAVSLLHWAPALSNEVGVPRSVVDHNFDCTFNPNCTKREQNLEMEMSFTHSSASPDLHSCPELQPMPLPPSPGSSWY